MSQRSEQLSEMLDDVEPAFDRLREVYHVPVLVGLFAFMLWVRVSHWQRFVTGDRVLFSGNDAWYHYRMVQYTVEHFPATMPFDPWTHFPVGTSVGQFGTLFDQLVAAVALLVGLGSPTEKQVGLVLLFAPAVFGALVALPLYLIGKRLGGRAGGLLAVLILALTPGAFLQRSVVGFSDHHVAESLFMAIAVALLLKAFAVAQRDRPIWELVRTGEYEPLAPTLRWSALAGVALGLYIWVWPPGVFLLGMLGVALVTILSLHYVRGISPDHVAIAGGVAAAVAGLVTLIPINEFGISATSFSLTQPLVAFGVAALCLFMAALARYWDNADLPRLAYPLAVVGVGAVAAGAAAVLAPDVFSFFVNQVLRVVGLGATSTARTVGEARPPRNAAAFLQNSYGLAFYTGVTGLFLLAYRSLVGDEPRAEHVFVGVWFVFLTFATLTQVRFDYYLVLAVGATNAYLLSVVFDLVDVGTAADDLPSIELYQVLTVFTVLLLVAAPLVAGQNNVVASADRSAQPGSVQYWEGTLEWMQENTPAQGAYGTGDDPRLKYYGTYERTDDFQYRNGEYGTLSWWDYGHWITVMGHRIPDANPFQQGARRAANILLGTNESAINEQMVNADGEETRYVVLDYQLGYAGTQKFTAPAAWEERHNVSTADLQTTIYGTRGGRLQVLAGIHTQRSYESFRVRLYQFHGSRTEPQPTVVDYDVQQYGGRAFAVPPQDGQFLKQFDNLSAARQFVENDRTSQVGGLGGMPSEPVPALQHYRLVHASNVTTQTPTGGVEPWVKVFERVPGATVHGQGPPNETVTARVPMQMGNRVFFYRQQATTDANGNFTMTLPYSTTGYDEWGTREGYTNVSVRAGGPYQFYTPTETNETAYAVRWQASANVTEGQVIGENDTPVSVDLNRTVVDEPGGANVSDGGAGNQTSGNGTAGGNQTADGGAGDGNESSGGDGSSSMRAPTRERAAGH